LEVLQYSLSGDSLGERTLHAVTYTSGSIYRPPLELLLVIRHQAGDFPGLSIR
jgi:hypothetical protein